MGIRGHIFYWVIILFSLFCVVTYWLNVHNIDEVYPLVGAGIAAHGALIVSIIHYYKNRHC